VYRFDVDTGVLIDIPVGVGSGLGGATAFLAFNDRGDLFVSSQTADEILRYSAGPLVTLSEPSDVVVTVSFSTASGSATSGIDFSGVSGQLAFLPGEISKRILITPLEDVTLEPAESFTVNLSDPHGAIIADGQGAITIANRQTKFFVVDDRPSQDAVGRSVQDETFKYESSGAPIVANDLYLGSPQNARGVASNVVGTRLWTIDANGNVHVTDNRNFPLGYWTARSVIQPEGIATNGTDVWIVDAWSDKVYRYTGAASRTSGSQNAASSFKLNNNNRNPKDIVTNGTHLWVVEDGTTDKVFKYTQSGSLVGSWTITTSGATKPTGITLDPAAPSDIWIVDNGTDRVYQYNSAAARTSGSQSAATFFALAPGNTNPQGIADPPLAAGADAAVILSSLADGPSWSTKLPSRNYSPTRRTAQSVTAQRPGSEDLILLTQSTRAAERGFDDTSRWHTWKVQADVPALDAAFESLFRAELFIKE
jgi:hypothetical protein